MIATALLALSIAGLDWHLPEKFAKVEGNVLTVDIPATNYPSSAMAWARVPRALWEGKGGVLYSVEAEGARLAKPTQGYLGLKSQVHWRDGGADREEWKNVKSRIGDFARTRLYTFGDFDGAKPDFAEVQIGLQSTSGRVTFDLSTFRIEPWRSLMVAQNPDRVVGYPTRVTGDIRRRGVMLPSGDPTEDDFRMLKEWGVTLVRYQMVRGWGRKNDNRDIAEYNRWVDSRLDVLERKVLPCARRHGMKVVVDLHVAPGGRDDSGQMNMLAEPQYAEAFVDCWRRIATRFRGNADAIYGYDLINEPSQVEFCECGYWDVQRKAAEVVRAIDPDTTIIIESNQWDSPGAFFGLGALDMDNVIYQAHMYLPFEFTHQGVNGMKRGFRYPDEKRGWNRDALVKILAPVRAFEKRHKAKIYIGEFSAITWAEGADRYIRDCISIFEEYGWDWTYHAFREWTGWSVEHEGPDADHLVPSADNPRKRALLSGFKAAGAGAPPSVP